MTKTNLESHLAGSCTVSQFVTNPADPSQVKLVAEQSTGGEFPMSLAYSTQKKMLCALNGGAKNGIRCFKVNAQGMTPIAGSDRNLGLNQTTPPAGPANTLSDILFNEDSSALMVSFKGNPDQPGFLATFTVGPNGELSPEPVKTTPKGGLLPFSLTLIPVRMPTVYVASLGNPTLTLICFA